MILFINSFQFVLEVSKYDTYKLLLYLLSKWIKIEAITNRVLILLNSIVLFLSPSESTMVIVCSICHDDVNERPQSLPEGQEVIVLALRCGHIYHEVCITEWFKKSAPPYRGPERVTTRVQ